MAIILDLIGSFAIRGAIVLVMLRLNVSLQQTLYLKTANANVRANLAQMVNIITTDFRQLGYGVTGSAFIINDTSSVKFMADFSNNGSIDTIFIYRSGDEVYRQQNSSTPLRVAIGVTEFRFEYYDYTGVQTAVVNDIRSIGLSAAIEENYVIKETGDGQDYRPSAKSVSQFFPQNL